MTSCPVTAQYCEICLRIFCAPPVTRCLKKGMKETTTIFTRILGIVSGRYDTPLKRVLGYSSGVFLSSIVVGLGGEIGE